MKSHGISSPMKSSHNKILLFTIYLIGLIISNSPVKSYPSWDTQTTITDFGRNIRQLPCVSRRTGETGVCMFAYSCAKVNGTHLGTCIDRFYFGSCCKTQSNTDVEINEPDNYLSNLDNDVVGPSVTSNVRPTSSTDRYSMHTSSQANLISSSSSTVMSSYKPTSQFALSSSTPSSTTSTSTSKNQYTEISNSVGTRPTYSSGSASSVTSAYSTTISQSTKPVPSTTFSTVRPSVKPSSYKPPPQPIRDQTPPPSVATTHPKPKPQTAKPTVQFSVPSSTAAPYNSPHSPASSHEAMKPTSPYTTAATSPRPLNSTTTTATFSTTKPVVKPSSTTYKSTTVPSSTTVSPPPQKVKPQTTAKPTTKPPKPSSSFPSSTFSSSSSFPSSSSSFPSSTFPSSSFPSSTFSSSSARPEPASTYESVTGSSSAIRSTVENVTESLIANLTAAATAAMNYASQTASYGSSTTVTSTSPTLVTWTTLDKVPDMPSDNTRPPTATYKPSGIVDGSTLPSWVKLPVETHEPNTAGTPPQPPPSTNVQSSTSMRPKPTTNQNPSDNDIIMTSNSVNTVSSTTQYPSSTLSMLTSAATTAAPMTTDTVEDASVPLNMSNYKEVCGRRLFPTARIVGGEKVTFGKWPWQISLRQWRTSTYLHKCGAALFNENWAVTAAHCVENVPPSDLLLRLGEHDLSVEEEPYGYEERRIQIVASHPQFDPRTFEYDLALLRFYEPVKFQPNIIPVCVPEDDSNFVSSSAYVTGWGRLYEDGPLPSVLQEVTVPVINNSVCETMYRAAGYIEHIPDIFICAGWKKGGFDSCEGDSGGPMVIQRPDKRWLLAGIISWGIGCAEPNQPGVYTRISKFKDWINQILQF